MQLIVPAADLSELHYAKIKEQSLELRLQHVQHIILVTGTVAESLIVVKLEP